MLGLLRLRSLYRRIGRLSTQNTPGDLVECGVAKGGSARIMFHAMRDSGYSRRLYLFDSFEGMPSPTENDPDYKKAVTFQGKCRGDKESLEKFFRENNGLSQVEIIKGWYHETLTNVQVTSIALLHIDCDWHDSVKLCLDTFSDKVIVNGYIQIDDYFTWQGCKVAVDKFIKTRADCYTLTIVDNSAIVLKKIRP